MKKIIVILALIIVSAGMFAQSEKEAYTKAVNAIIREKGAAEKDSLYQDLVVRFADYRATIGNNVKDVPVRAVAYAFIAEGDTAGALRYSRQISDKTTLPSQLSSLGNVSLKAEQKDLARQFFKGAVEAYEAITDVPNPQEKYAPAFYTEYATALVTSGNPTEALLFARKAYEINNSNKVALVTYAKLLSDNKQYTEALPVLEEAIRKGVADSGLRADYKEAYFKVYGEKGFQERLAALNRQQQEEAYAELRGQMISETAPYFSLQDLDGKIWSLADLKGKTVVLDFWATWCAPCKKSFPAMQLAVNKYKNDPSVVFLFVHTWEHSPDAVKDVEKFITDNNYDFHVLMDLKKDGSNEVVTKYKIQGIPSKFIIDGGGNTRFKMTGFTGSDEAAVQELSAMIELAKISTKKL